MQTCLPCATLDWSSPRGAANDSVSPFELGVCACPGTTASGPCCPSELLKEPPRLSRLAVLRAVWMQVPTKDRACSRECDDVGAVPHIERPVDAAVRRRAAAGDPRRENLRCSAPQGPASPRAQQTSSTPASGRLALDKDAATAVIGTTRGHLIAGSASDAVSAHVNSVNSIIDGMTVRTATLSPRRFSRRTPAPCTELQGAVGAPGL